MLQFQERGSRCPFVSIRVSPGWPQILFLFFPHFFLIHVWHVSKYHFKSCSNVGHQLGGGSRRVTFYVKRNEGSIVSYWTSRSTPPGLGQQGMRGRRMPREVKLASVPKNVHREGTWCKQAICVVMWNTFPAGGGLRRVTYQPQEKARLARVPAAAGIRISLFFAKMHRPGMRCFKSRATEASGTTSGWKKTRCWQSQRPPPTKSSASTHTQMNR